MFKEINILRRVFDPFKLNEIDPLTRSVNKKTVDVEQHQNWRISFVNICLQDLSKLCLLQEFKERHSCRQKRVSIRKLQNFVLCHFFDVLENLSNVVWDLEVHLVRGERINPGLVSREIQCVV